MKLAEMTRQLEADQQYANSESKRVTDRSHIKVANAHHENIPDNRVKETPENVHDSRGKPFAGRLRKGRLEGPSQHAANKMGDGVGQENSTEEVRHKIKPGHG